jgi:hypothetical protein
MQSNQCEIPPAKLISIWRLMKEEDKISVLCVKKTDIFFYKSSFASRTGKERAIKIFLN